MASLAEDIDTAADWVSKALSSSGYLVDFSPARLWSVDRFLDDNSVAGLARPGGLLAQNLGFRLFALGAYTGEVIRRAVGAHWRTNDQERTSGVPTRRTQTPVRSWLYIAATTPEPLPTAPS
jgi:hypothetical protein